MSNCARATFFFADLASATLFGKRGTFGGKLTSGGIIVGALFGGGAATYAAFGISGCQRGMAPLTSRDPAHLHHKALSNVLIRIHHRAP